ncbi:heparinase II/III family protein [Lutibaculum baratangense]|nr:heparinase II/III family protein [Lutibaculum baratangense]
MARSALQDRLRLGALVAGQEFRAVLGTIYASPFYRWRFSGGAAERLIVAPQDLRTADPTVAEEIYSGRFPLAGRVGETQGRSPFSAEPPSLEWARELHGFGWLRHLRAADTELARSQARALVSDWIAEFGRYHRIAWEPEVVARRLIAWFSHSPLILSGADRTLYRRFMRSLARQARYLYRAGSETRAGAPRVTAAIALCHAGLCMSGRGRLLKRATRWLTEELEAQILPDGGHVSRNPRILIELLVDLLPLRQTFSARDTQPPQVLISTIDRMMPMLRFFRHADGALAQFNGMGATPADLLATLLAYDEALGAPVSNAAFSGYQRIQARGSVVIVDTGKPPPPVVSGEATASCLAFEFSSGGCRLIVNCGSPLHAEPGWKRVARSTAAHSTVTINDTSSARFASGRFLTRRLGPLVLAGPRDVPVERTEDEEQTVRASHDGYLGTFGIVHERRLTLDAMGSSIDGEEVFHQAGRRHRGEDAFAVRFHLHPNVRASQTRDGESIILMTPKGDAWEFTSPDVAPRLEESIFLGGFDLPRRAEQIVLHGSCAAMPKVSWRLERAHASKRPPRPAPAPELPLAEPQTEAPPPPPPPTFDRDVPGDVPLDERSED